MYIIKLCVLYSIVLAPKIIHTRSHPDPEPPRILYDPKKLIRKKILTEIQWSISPPPRSNSLPERFFTIENIKFDIPFEHSFFRTKYEIFLGEIVFDQTTLSPYRSEHQSVDPNLDTQALQQLEKIEDLVTDLDQAICKSYLHQSVKISSLSFFVSPPITQSIHHVSTSSISSTISTTSPSTSQVIIQTILVPSRPTPPLSSSLIHPHIPVMAARLAHLVLPTMLHNMPHDYKTIIPKFDGTRSITTQQHVDNMNDYFDLQ